MTEEELILAIEEARKQGVDNDEGYLTTKDLMRVTSLSEEAVLRVLRHYKSLDRLDTKRITREGLAGKSRVPAYKIILTRQS